VSGSSAASPAAAATTGRGRRPPCTSSDGGGRAAPLGSRGWSTSPAARRPSSMSSTAGNRVAVVTGAASGLGRALALALARLGATLELSDVDARGLEETATRCRELGAGAKAHVVDVADHAEVAALADTVVDEHGAVRMLINNAGIALVAQATEQQLADVHRLLDVNLRGVIKRHPGVPAGPRGVGRRVPRQHLERVRDRAHAVQQRLQRVQVRRARLHGGGRESSSTSLGPPSRSRASTPVGSPPASPPTPRAPPATSSCSRPSRPRSGCRPTGPRS
jgi:hypothetical protein